MNAKSSLFEKIKDLAVILTAICALVTALYAIYATNQLLRQARVEHGVSLFLKFEEHYDYKLLQTRERIAKAYLKNKEDVNYTYIMNFFETIGLLLKYDVLNEKLLWNNFSYAFFRWYHAGKDFLKADRETEDNPTLYENVMHLYSRLDKIEKERRGASSSQTIDQAELDLFMEGEARASKALGL